MTTPLRQRPGLRLRELLTHHGVSERDFAVAVGMSQHPDPALCRKYATSNLRQYTHADPAKWAKPELVELWADQLGVPSELFYLEKLPEAFYVETLS